MLSAAKHLVTPTGRRGPPRMLRFTQHDMVAALVRHDMVAALVLT